MSDIIKDVITQFKKTEIAQVMEEIGCKYDPSMSREKIAELAIDYLRKIATDENTDIELSDLAYELAITAEIIDEEGNLLKKTGDVITGDVIGDFTIDGKPKPACYGFEDDRDPSCQKCPVKDACKKQRVKIHPKCFGTDKRDETNPECRACIEFEECGKAA